MQPHLYIGEGIFISTFHTYLLYIKKHWEYGVVCDNSASASVLETSATHISGGVFIWNSSFFSGDWYIKGVENMATEKTYPMTQEGKQKLENELEDLKTVKRKEVVERIKIARSFGDLSENSEYDAAKDEQAFVEGRITQLENMIRNAVIITDNGEESTVVTLGKTVTFKELPGGDEESYTIVGSAEADPFEGRISNDSPIAKSLLGKQIGEKVAIQTPGGEMQVEIISVK